MNPVPARELVVVKLGGTTLADQAGMIEDVARRSRDVDIVLVHGGGKRLTEWLSRLGVESRFEDGLRVTDDAALEVALAVLRGVVNTELVAALRGHGADAVGRLRRRWRHAGGRTDAPAGPGGDRHRSTDRPPGDPARGAFPARGGAAGAR